ncbi:nucleotidyl transferase AbiEii/AbiGii toxin family protein [Pseudonocardia humida]|uniref:Nucleotidyl transferase AbiEii/AbiGii toxin family protein n=1 Tax=Pseudonocardia humida TaxID=2800819 RepID=A0ABT1A393_9PSEU|nr:nucleotidyl transferase AbiEii/AbiGii toxin family protein [Pseudonocardia humida]
MVSSWRSAALAAQQLTSRPTHDLDLFTRVGASSVPEARDAFEAAARDRGWTVERIRDADTFCRLIVHGDDDLLVDLALDSPPTMPPSASFAGPTFGLEELAGRKVVALFDRAEARDFVDVFALTQHYPKDLLLRRASEVDAGFDPGVLATMLGSLNRFPDPTPAFDPGRGGRGVLAAAQRDPPRAGDGDDRLRSCGAERARATARGRQPRRRGAAGQPLSRGPRRPMRTAAAVPGGTGRCRTPPPPGRPGTRRRPG